LHGVGPYLESLGSPARDTLAAALWKAHRKPGTECRRIGGSGGRAEYRDMLARIASDIAGELGRRDRLARQVGRS
jgi:hypothetical protein